MLPVQTRTHERREMRKSNKRHHVWVALPDQEYLNERTVRQDGRFGVCNYLHRESQTRSLRRYEHLAKLACRLFDNLLPGRSLQWPEAAGTADYSGSHEQGTARTCPLRRHRHQRHCTKLSFYGRCTQVKPDEIFRPMYLLQGVLCLRLDAGNSICLYEGKFLHE